MRILLLAGIALFVGCASRPPGTLESHLRGQIGRVAVVTIPATPTIDIVGIPNKLEGGGIGAASSASWCLIQFPIALIYPPTLVACLIAGAGSGAVMSESDKNIHAARLRMQESLAPAQAQKVFRDEVAKVTRDYLADRYVELPDAQVVASDPDYRALALLGADTLLEVSIASVTTAGDGLGRYSGMSELIIEARVRLIRVRDAAILLDTKYGFAGSRRSLADWKADGVIALQSEFDLAYTVLGKHIIEHAFMLYPFPDRQFVSAGLLNSVTFGLAPEYPLMRGPREHPFPGWIWTPVDSLQPVMRWESFPGTADLAVAPAEMARVSNVTYDLVIAAERNDSPARLVYRREKIAANFHKLDVPLEPDRRYFWSVRARFDLDGRFHVTEWARTIWDLGRARASWEASDVISPHALSYRFSTARQ